MEGGGIMRAAIAGDGQPLALSLPALTNPDVSGNEQFSAFIVPVLTSIGVA